jgi:hypothetical protein
MDSEGVQKRRELLLEMMRKDRSRRREQGEAVSSTDEGQDTRRVDAELLGMARQARRPVESRRRNRGESEQLESLLMDSEGVQKRRELLLEMMRKDRSRRREQGEAVSSTDEEQDTRRVDAELLGMARQARRPVESRRRNRGESEQLESLLMDSEGVQKRRELLLEMMRKDRSKRREQGEAVSSTDEEQDTRRFYSDLVGWITGKPRSSRKRYGLCIYFFCPLLHPLNLLLEAFRCCIHA